MDKELNDQIKDLTLTIERKEADGENVPALKETLKALMSGMRPSIDDEDDEDDEEEEEETDNEDEEDDEDDEQEQEEEEQEEGEEEEQGAGSNKEQIDKKE